MAFVGRAVLCLALLATTLPQPAAAQANRVSFIRDAEIEDTIRRLADPIFAVAGLDASVVRVHVVNDRALNAFVAGGQRIFIHTGLLLAADTPNQIVGVIAHETGHIVGGHLARTQDALQGATAPMIAALLLGVAAAAAGAPEAAAGILAGGAQASQRLFLSYSRVQESAADQAALAFLQQTGQSPKGMMQFFEKFVGQEALLTTNQDPYVRSHPLPRERIETMRRAVDGSPVADRKDSDEAIVRHARMQAKLHGFLDPPERTLRSFPASDRGVPARYARAVAYHRMNATQQALAEIDSLIAEAPEDPYYHELKGQILFEGGQIAASVPPYERALRLAPNQPLIRMGLAQSQLATEQAEWLAPATATLERTVRDDPDNAQAWHWLSIAYARADREGEAALAAAERFMVVGDWRYARLQADRSLRLVKSGSPEYLRAQDIKQSAEYRLKDAAGR